MGPPQFLAAALLFVVGSYLPPTSFLTRIDVFVVVSLLVQFGVAVVSWILGGGFGHIAKDDADNLEFAGELALPSLYMLSLLVFFVPPLYRQAHMTSVSRPDYPVVAAKDKNRQLPFHPFVIGKNVFF
jgi:hypothetical protein